MVRLGRGKNKIRPNSRENIEFQDFQLSLMLLLLGLLPLSNELAQLAGVFAIEGFCQGLGEGGGVLRIADGHANPGDRLQKTPVRYYRSAQRDHKNPL